jgi:hypothetical protein
VPNFALIKDDMVQNVIVADAQQWVNDNLVGKDKEFDEAVDVTDKVIGPGYIKKGKDFVAPPESPSPTSS